MTRFVSSSNQTAAAAAHMTLTEFVDLEYDSGTIRFCNAPIDITFASNTYLGLGEFGGIERVMEATAIEPRSMKLTLSGLDAALITDTLTEDYFNRTVRLYQGWLDEDYVLIADPEEVWSGRMDSQIVILGKGSGDIIMNCEHILARGPNITYDSDEDQKTRHATDRFFDQLPFVNKEVIWGGQRFPGGGPGGRRGGEKEILP